MRRLLRTPIEHLSKRSVGFVLLFVLCFDGLATGTLGVFYIWNRAELRAAICDVFGDVSKTPTSEQKSPLAKKIVHDSQRSARRIGCPSHG